MGQNKRWKRKAKRIMGESYKGCDYCIFLNADPYGYDDCCNLYLDEEECSSLIELRKITKGNTFIDFFGDKLV